MRTIEHLIKIDWSELDLFGHVNNVSFFKYIQSARVNFWEQTGIYKMYLEEKKGPILASSLLDFKQQLNYPGSLIIRTRTEFIKNSSFGFHHQILNEKNEIAAEGKDVMVFFDFSKNEKMLVPDIIRSSLTEL